MIDPAYLASLRVTLRAELVLSLVQIEQITPGWWQDMTALGDQLGIGGHLTNKIILKLERKGLLRRCTYGNCGGTWVWWVAKHHNDAPQPTDEPAWLLRDMKCGITDRVTITGRWDWAKQRNIPRYTLSALLHGHQRTLYGRWKVVGTPFDFPDQPDAA